VNTLHTGGNIIKIIIIIIISIIIPYIGALGFY
jgi:hypothetical protein